MSTTEMKMQQQPFVFDPSVLCKKQDIPAQLIWAEEDRVTPDSFEELDFPVIDIAKFLKGLDHDPQSIAEIKKQISEACEKHGFFQVAYGGIDPELIKETQRLTKHFFDMSLAEKERAKRIVGELYGYASSFTGRFTSNLPWKETFTIPSINTSQYIDDKLGGEFQHYGDLMEKFCKEMNSLCLDILEVLGETLGVGRSTFRDFYADSDSSIFRVNYYPSCPKPDLTLGTGPHYDPTSITILTQDDVAGLQVLVDGKWRTVKPKPNAFVVNIGDTFMAFTNKRYKSCLHRAVVSTEKTRTSIVYFLCPRKDKIIRTPEKLVDAENPRAYPDFTWGLLETFTQLHHRADSQTANVFAQWLKENGMATV